MAFTPGTAVTSITEVELTISCRSLRGLNFLLKPCPMVIIYCQAIGETKWIELNRTETIENSYDPDFTKKIVIPYHFEENQPLLFKVFDVDDYTSSKLQEHFSGMASCTLAQMVSTGKVELLLSKHDGKIIVSVEELQSIKDNVIIQFGGNHLDKKKLLGKSDPFLVIMKDMGSGDFSPVLKTEVIKETVDPEWKKFVIPLRTLCNGDNNRTIKVICYHWVITGDHHVIGEFETTLRDLREGPGPKNVYSLINQKKKKKKRSYHNSGTIIVTHFAIQKTYSFLEYIKGGMELHCSFAIDFSGSNGDPTSPDSLHFISHVPNPYEIAIQSVGYIIKEYDSDQEFPVLGFGACIPPDTNASHEFYVNMSTDNPYCTGIEGVLNAYRSCIGQVQPYGPSYFAPVINHIANFASIYRDGRNYFILLIITDGVIGDLPETIQAIITASFHPMSIIIVGVGTADFSAMEKLYPKYTALTASDGQEAVRDIVQFVPLCNFIHPGADPHLAMFKLAKEVLAKVPTQFLSYMQMNDIVPGPLPAEGQPIVLPPDPELLALQ